MNERALDKLRRAAGKLQTGDARAALAECEAILETAPEEPEALHLRALALSRLGHVDDAIAAFERAAALHARKDAVYANYGNCLKAAGRFDAAAKAYRDALAFAPNSADALNGLALVQDRLGDAAGAVASLRKAIEVAPRHPQALNNLGARELSEGKLDEAVALFSRAIEAAPGMASAYVNRGAALRRLGKLDAALADHRRAAEIAPNLPEAAYQLASSLRSAGDFEAARTAYQKALALAPARTDVHRDLASMMFEIGASAEVFAEIDRALAASPASPMHVLRGETAILLGDARAALASAQAALRLAPESAAANGLLARAALALGERHLAVDAARRAHALAPDDFALRHSCCEIEMAEGLLAEAAARLEGPALRDHLQKHLALRATAQRALGDQSYKTLYDFDRLTAQIKIDPPGGYSSLDAFNEALRAAIEPLHRTKNRPVDQTLYGGTQSIGRLWNNPDPVIQAYVGAMRAAARRYIDQLPDDPDHPYLARKNGALECAGAWSVILGAGGGHVDHIHPAGWVSACYYVHSPQALSGGARAGQLRLGASGVAGLDLPAERWFEPLPGTVVFFPSYVWHGVEKFEASEPRITAPFDLSVSP